MEAFSYPQVHIFKSKSDREAVCIVVVFLVGSEQTLHLADIALDTSYESIRQADGILDHSIGAKRKRHGFRVLTNTIFEKRLLNF